jgi:RNA polymerase sigma-70 factor (ECF subfamily)
MADVARDETTIREAWAAGDFTLATTHALRLYGPEVLGYLVTFQKDHDSAGDAFSLFSQRLWETLPAFEWRCSLRTWCYRLARNAAIDMQRSDTRRREVGLSSAPEVLALAARTRTETLSALRTAKRTALEELRDGLSEEDRTMLVLRVDRQLDWREIAVVMDATKSGLAEDDVTREAARLRKRFQLVKDRLRSLARERGIR